MATTNGAIITDFGGFDKGSKVFVTADGKITVLGLTSGFNGDDLAIARYNANGSLDTSFDTDGKLTATSVMTINNVTLLADGKFITVGTNGSDFAVARYNNDGSLDTTFDTDGIVTIHIYGTDSANNVLVQPDGKLVVVGSYSNNSGFAVARYLPDGSLDTSFSSDGYLYDYFGDYATSAAIQIDGKIVVAGNYSNDFGVMRFNRDGSYDISFSGDGEQYNTLGGTEIAKIVRVLSSGKILVAGSSDGNFGAVRYNFDGSLDTSFDTDGKLVVNLGGNTELNDMILQPDGKFLAVGTNTANKDILLIRVNADGSLDTSFDTDGKVTTDLGGWEEGKGITLQADGKILVTGFSDTDFALLRYNSDGSLDTAFNGTGGSTSPTNKAHTGTVTISDTTPSIGDNLIANNTLADADGLGALHYSWKANETAIGSDSKSVLITANEIGKTITVTVSYTDKIGTLETESSAPTSPVTEKSAAGITIIGTDFATSEAGDTASFSVQLNSAPARDVTITFSSSDVTEGKITTNPKLVFTASNWNTPQIVTVTGQNDTEVDGDTAYSLNATVTTLDVIYKSIKVNSLALTNKDTPIPTVEKITGTDDIDILAGTDAPSYILGKSGDDDLSGGGGNDTLYGSYGDDLLFGDEGDDYLWGEQDADYLDGGRGNDTLDGGLGADTMIGGIGNDTYYLGYDAKDVIMDNGLPGDLDTVIMPYNLSSYTLPQGIESGTISAGTQASNLTGNTSNNSLTGNAGNNTLNGNAGLDSLVGGAGNDILIGGAGNDRLTGGAGRDTFKFNAPLNSNMDEILDFNMIDDTVQLENGIFTALKTTGVLPTANFIKGVAAADANDYIIYNPTSGVLLYDSDGNGASNAIQIAILGKGLSLTSADFVVI